MGLLLTMQATKAMPRIQLGTTPITARTFTSPTSPSQTSHLFLPAPSATIRGEVPKEVLEVLKTNQTRLTLPILLVVEITLTATIQGGTSQIVTGQWGEARATILMATIPMATILTAAILTATTHMETILMETAPSATAPKATTPKATAHNKMTLSATPLPGADVVTITTAGKIAQGTALTTQQ